MGVCVLSGNAGAKVYSEDPESLPLVVRVIVYGELRGRTNLAANYLMASALAERRISKTGLFFCFLINRL